MQYTATYKNRSCTKKAATAAKVSKLEVEVVKVCKTL
jgi:hypothetical protein